MRIIEKEQKIQLVDREMDSWGDKIQRISCELRKL